MVWVVVWVVVHAARPHQQGNRRKPTILVDNGVDVGASGEGEKTRHCQSWVGAGSTAADAGWSGLGAGGVADGVANDPLQCHGR